MKKILLTSAGFDNKKVAEKFLQLVNKPVNEIKILFITTAAVEPDAVMILPACIEDLTKVCGIPLENLTIYDMHKLISKDEIMKYDAIYMCGGKTEYLVERIDEVGFKQLLDAYIANGGVYVGVSAGSIVGSGSFKTGLDFLKNDLDVHCDNGSTNGTINTEEPIYLTNNQAIFIDDNSMTIFE